MFEITADLKAWATPTQASYIDAVIRHGSITKAAEALGRHPNSIRAALTLVRLTAAGHGYSPEHGLNSPIPSPFVAKGHSTLERVGPNGERTQVLQWTKTKLDDVQWAEQVQAGIAAFLADVEPLPVGPRSSDFTNDDIVPWIQIGDAHLGMLAHEAETGANFDLKIAERELMFAIGMLIDELPKVERLVINDLGDFTHYENFKGVTEASGHALDIDTRFPKMIEVYSRLMRNIIDRALTKANVVDVIINQGNHSRTNDIWMAELLRVAYGASGRVNVLNNSSPFIAYRMGNTFVLTHHSDQCRPDRLAAVMATDYAEDWGATEFRYIDVGHIHHKMTSKEHPGVMIESWNQLASKDKWANDNGYRSRQSISVVYRSRTFGDVGRRVLPVQQVQAAIRRSTPDHYIAPKARAFVA